MPRNAGPGPIQILPTGGNVIANGAPPTPGKSKISSFFGWKGNGNNSPIAESSPTTISERSSPAQSPNGTSLSSFQSSVKHMPTAIDVPKANASTLFAAGYQNPPLTPAMSVQIEEMEEELREISVELASSIRREMELEDQVDRLQTEGPGALERDRRTSDYYSDSGTSSVREPEAGAGAGVDKLKRQSEQEKAQWRLDLSQKLQEERGRRRALEDHIRSLEEHIQNVGSITPSIIYYFF